MWTQAHRARHDARLKEVVAMNAVAQRARWLERVDPPRSGRATPYGAVVPAIAWHLRVGGSWPALPCTLPAWRTVYGWFRRWMSLGLFDRLLADAARRRRRAMGRRAKPRLSIIDTQAVKCIPVRGPRGYDANKKVLGRKRVALVDTDGTLRMAPGWPLPLSPPRCRTATRSKLLIEARRRGPACGRRSWTGPSRSEEHTSELQSRQYLVCRLLLEKKKK